MEAFWDTSGLVPVCVTQPSSAFVAELLRGHSVRTWWGSRVEMQSAFSRLSRLGQLDATEYEIAQAVLNQLITEWVEVGPSAAIRSEAQRFVTLYPLKAADALQLSAAYSWAKADPEGKLFVSGDRQLLSAARQRGFAVIAT